MAGAWTSNRGTVLPALANLMNPVEPDPRYPQRHQQENRAQAFTSQPHSHSSFPSSNSVSSNNPNHTPSPSPFSASGENPTVTTSRQPPAFAGPPISRQLAPLSALTAALPPPNGRFASYPHHQTSRSDPKIYGSGRNFHPSGSYSSLEQPFPRGSPNEGHGQEGHNNHTLPPLRSGNASSGWKDPSSSPSTASSSTKSNSTSPQPTNWNHHPISRRGSDCVHGRAYLSEMDAFPSDEKEQDRLDLSHKIYLLLMKGALHWAPIGNDIKKILDIGTGTGIWSIEMAEKYPNSTIVGIDVLNLQPKGANSELSIAFRVPQNVIFQMLDAETTWPWVEKFDYIHTRSIAGCIENWPRLYEQSFHNLKPGGYIELQEYGTQVFSPDPGVDPLRDGSVIAKWSFWFNEASRLSGRPPGYIVTQSILSDLAAAGFVDIRQEVLMLPLGLWHQRREMKELGGYGLLNMLDGTEGFTFKLFTKYLGWTEDKCHQLVQDVRAEFKKGVRLYTKQFVVWGRKPLPGETVGPRAMEPPIVKVPYPANGQNYFK